MKSLPEWPVPGLVSTRRQAYGSETGRGVRPGLRRTATSRLRAVLVSLEPAMKNDLKTRLYVSAAAISTAALAVYALAAPYSTGN